MFATIDDHHLLTIKDDTLDTGKHYQQDFQGYHVSEKNTLLFVSHKKEIKLIELKNIGSTMGVFYIAERPPFHQLRLVPEGVQLAWEHFGGFNEETGEKYHFFPAFPTQRVEAVNTIFATLGIPLKVQQTTKGVISPRKTTVDLPRDASVEQLLSYLFGLTLLYGKFEAKHGELNGIKIQLPLPGTYLGLEEVLQQRIQHLQQKGIFLQSSLNVQRGKNILQITSNDWELLQMFADWYKPIEKFTQITKKEHTVQAMGQLLAFLEDKNLENKTELALLVQQGTVKILIKT